MTNDFEDTATVAYEWDLVTDEVRWGENVAIVTGITDVEQLSTGIGYADLFVATSPLSRYEAIMASGGCDAGGGVPYQAIYGVRPARRSSAPPIWVEDMGRWFADGCDRPSRAHGTIRVITERFEAERRLAASDVDMATGTFSQAHFIAHLTRHLAVAARGATTFAVMIIEIGPAVADEPVGNAAIARTLAHLREDMRAEEGLARHGASTFAVLLQGCNAEQCAAAAERFIARVAEPLAGVPAMRARIGAVLAPTHGRTPDTILRFAEEALDTARLPDGPAYHRYDTDLVRSPARIVPQVSDELLSALNEGRIALATQPIVDAKSRSIVSQEGLVRICRPDGSVILPDAIIPLATKNGLLALVERRVLDLAFFALTSDRKLKLSINATRASLGEAAWLDHLRALCKMRPDAARRLTVDIAESDVVADIDAAQAIMTAIKALGVSIAIDDFGSGQWSFRTLQPLPIDCLKIDGAFARDLGSPHHRAFIRSLVDLGRNLKVTTVAKWIEDEATANTLGDWGVDCFQGHLFGKAEIVEHTAVPRRANR